MKSRKTLLLILVPLLCCCSDRLERKVVSSDDQTENLTIVYKDDKRLIFNRIVSTDSLPMEGYVINEGGIEYYPALVSWEDGIVYLYHHYGSFNESQNTGKIVLTDLSIQEFEEKAKDSAYKYFYY